MIKPGEKASGVRWRWVLIVGAGAAALTFALMYLTINVYAGVLSILSRGDVDRAALDRFAGIMAVWGLPALYWLLITGAAWLVRSLGAATVRHWPTSTKLTDSEPEGGGEAPPRDPCPGKEPQAQERTSRNNGSVAGSPSRDETPQPIAFL
jgi:hypothetical protein